jgi:cobalamin biosynthesis protein CobD/CbiB
VNWGVLIVAVLTFLTAVLTWLSTRKKIDAIHVLVDGNMSKVLAALGVSQDRSAQLAKTLERADVEVPDPPSSASAP